MTDAQKRALRTLIQALAGGLLVTLYQVFAPPDRKLTTEQAAAVTAALTALAAFAQNWLESQDVIKPLLK